MLCAFVIVPILPMKSITHIESLSRWLNDFFFLIIFLFHLFRWVLFNFSHFDWFCWLGNERVMFCRLWNGWIIVTYYAECVQPDCCIRSIHIKRQKHSHTFDFMWRILCVQNRLDININITTTTTTLHTVAPLYHLRWWKYCACLCAKF